MELGLRQSLRTELGLRLSPQILQKIEVLQLPSLDLAHLVEQELQENEALEQVPGEEARDEGTPETTAAEDGGEGEEWDGEDADNWSSPSARDGPSAMEVVLRTEAAPISLVEHLRGQLGLADLDDRVRAVVDALLEHLDDRGYFSKSFDLDEMAVDVVPQASLDERLQALEVVQGLDPSGVGARDIPECLLLQLSAEHSESELVSLLIREHMDDLAHNRIPQMAKTTGVTTDRILAARDVIRSLDPIPGRRFGGRENPVVRPDVVVEQVGDDFQLRMENDWIPDLTISAEQLRMSKDLTLDQELRSHIRSKIESARSLIEAVEGRKNTLHRVASELLDRQSEAMLRGPAALLPLRMQEVADALGLHVSTVSRTLSGKYMQTPAGIVSLKSFFSGEVTRHGSSVEEAASRHGVQQLVRTIIDREDKRRPLSDEAIRGLLAKGYQLDVARRTVTKYREKMGLGSSRQRKNYGSST
ncbi:MAG: RNA polymerase factor sigma-54 [Planctomycetota bacterium]|nr:RNA polymerase factor sigma-54 [Planctomycetota bacterium]